VLAFFLEGGIATPRKQEAARWISNLKQATPFFFLRQKGFL
jgi:hypothetical protein